MPFRPQSNNTRKPRYQVILTLALIVIISTHCSHWSSHMHKIVSRGKKCCLLGVSWTWTTALCPLFGVCVNKFHIIAVISHMAYYSWECDSCFWLILWSSKKLWPSRLYGILVLANFALGFEARRVPSHLDSIQTNHMVRRQHFWRHFWDIALCLSLPILL